MRGWESAISRSFRCLIGVSQLCIRQTARGKRQRCVTDANDEQPKRRTGHADLPPIRVDARLRHLVQNMWVTSARSAMVLRLDIRESSYQLG